MVLEVVVYVGVGVRGGRVGGGRWCWSAVMVLEVVVYIGVGGGGGGRRVGGGR